MPQPPPLVELSEANALPDPVAQFARWFTEAGAAQLPQPEAMALATTGSDGRPAVRTVLLKEFGRAGFTFFTNYRSRKGRELESDPRASLLFFWSELQRQVRIEGRVARVSESESDAYFHTRPRESRLGAWASPQSEELPDRAALERRYAEVEARFGEGDIPRPPHWGGYRLRPERIEFWQGRTGRLHDRLLYEPVPPGQPPVEGHEPVWRIRRLAP